MSKGLLRFEKFTVPFDPSKYDGLRMSRNQIKQDVLTKWVDEDVNLTKLFVTVKAIMDDSYKVKLHMKLNYYDKAMEDIHEMYVGPDEAFTFNSLARHVFLDWIKVHSDDFLYEVEDEVSSSSSVEEEKEEPKKKKQKTNGCPKCKDGGIIIHCPNGIALVTDKNLRICAKCGWNE